MTLCDGRRGRQLWHSRAVPLAKMDGGQDQRRGRSTINVDLAPVVLNHVRCDLFINPKTKSQSQGILLTNARVCDNP